MFWIRGNLPLSLTYPVDEHFIEINYLLNNLNDENGDRRQRPTRRNRWQLRRKKKCKSHQIQELCALSFNEALVK